MDEKKKFEVFLQPFSSEIEKDWFIGITCTKCKAEVISKVTTQTDLAAGGIGHKCKECNTYLAVIRCPNCSSTLTVDDEEWDKIAVTEGAECPVCKAILYRIKQEFGTTMMFSGIICPNFQAWSGSEIEKKYLNIISAKYTGQRRNKFAAIHHSVGVRMRASEEALKFLVENEWYSPVVISNVSSGVTNSSHSVKSPFDYEFHNYLFSLINNLRSSLDLVSQELIFFFTPDIPEKDIDFYKAEKHLSNSALAELIVTFRSSSLFMYLNKLRNVLQHRRIPLMATVGAYNPDELEGIKPKSIHSKAIIKLPSDPYEFSDDQTSNSFTIPLFPKIVEMHKETKDFVLKSYEIIIP